MRTGAPSAGSIRSRGEEGSVLIVALLIMVLLFMLGAGLYSTAESEAVITSNDELSEGAFYAAEAAVQIAIDQIGPNPAQNIENVVAAEQIGGQFTFRSGRRTDNAAEPPTYIGENTAPGYSIGSGTGYNTARYVFDIYQINATGTGPRNAQREVEVQVQYGPVAR